MERKARLALATSTKSPEPQTTSGATNKTVLPLLRNKQARAHSKPHPDQSSTMPPDNTQTPSKSGKLKLTTTPRTPRIKLIVKSPITNNTAPSSSPTTPTVNKDNKSTRANRYYSGEAWHASRLPLIGRLPLDLDEWMGKEEFEMMRAKGYGCAALAKKAAARKIASRRM